MAQDEKEREDKIKKQVQIKLDSIYEFSSKMKSKRKRVKSFLERNASEEALLLTERMGKIGERLESHSRAHLAFINER
jgi:hypothetical protein